MYGDAVEMITGIDTATLKKFKEMAEIQVEYYKRALRIRQDIMAEKESKSDMEANKNYEPEKYFTTRILDKEVSIVRTNRTTLEGKEIHEKKMFYAIKCSNWNPRRYKTEYDAYTKKYGKYENVDNAIKDYLTMILDLIGQLGADAYENYDLFF